MSVAAMMRIMNNQSSSLNAVQGWCKPRKASPRIASASPERYVQACAAVRDETRGVRAMTKNGSVDSLGSSAMEQDDVVLPIGARLRRARLAGRMRLRDVAEVVVQRAGTRPVTVVRNSIRLEQLVPPSEKRMLEGNIHVIEPGASNGGAIQHAGEEVGYVLSGEVELILGEAVYRLGTGDSFFFPSETPHSYRNVGAETARILWINTPVTF